MRKAQNQIVKLNGNLYLFNSIFTISDLLHYLGFNTNVLVVDYNGTVLEKILWSKTEVKTNDCIEILSIAGGG